MLKVCRQHLTRLFGPTAKIIDNESESFTIHPFDRISQFLNRPR